ncbi:MAG: helix-turn-helix domain-containing protein, partial [Thiobacillus sp.]|nr:helix-turn-helix domain-containing protein [Thiobacillus sp.]
MLRDKQTYKDAAKRLKAMREAKGISLPEIAERLGVSTARYRTWEKIFGPLPQRQYADALDRILENWGGTAGQPDGPSSPDGDLHDFAELGNRAAERRKSMGLNRTFVAGRIEISYPTFRTWEISLPRLHHGGHEDAWEDALEVPRGWLRHPSWPAPDLSAGTLDLTLSGAGSAADEIRAVGAWLTRKHPSGRTHEFSELSEQEQRQAIMFADRYGVCGDNRTGLQVIGDQFGLTRERVRQVVEAMAERARDIRFTLPKLEELKAAASGKEIRTVTSFEEMHRDLLGGVSLSDADRFTREILGTSIAAISDRAFAQRVNSLQPMIIDPAAQEIVVEVRTASLRMVRSCGAAHTMFVTGLVSEAIGKAVSIVDVRNALVAIEGMQWLTPDEDWYWLGPDTLNNRVLEGVRKVLATASRKVDVEDLHQAVCRSRRAYYKGEVRSHPPEIEVPQEVLREILSRVPWLTVIQMNDFL